MIPTLQIGGLGRARLLGGSTPPATDPYFANVVSLLHFDGTNGSTTFTDQIGKTWTATGACALSTVQKKFGTASIEFSAVAEQRIDCTSTDFNFGTADFTVEAQFRPGATSNRALFSFGSRLVYVAASNWAYYNGSGNQIVGGSPAANANFYHVALSRVSGVVHLFIDGTLLNSFAEAGAINPGAMRVGYFNSGNPCGGFVDEFRVTNGVGRYSSNFTPPAAPFPNS